MPYFTAEELTGRDIIIADNLKPRKMRGIESRGMLLAADYTDSEGRTCVEILGCPGVPPGTPLVFADGANASDQAVSKPTEIDADTFFACPMKIENGKLTIGGKVLSAAEKEIATVKTASGDVH